MSDVRFSIFGNHVLIPNIENRKTNIEIMAKHLETGKRAEDLAAAFLADKGYEIVARNYRSGHAEIDLIVKKDIFLVFVEVKSLYNIRFGNPEINVTRDKVKLVTRAAGNYVYYINWHQQIRFDIVSIIFRTEEDFEITHFEDAFY
jgi:putative endonuclease